MEKPILFNTKMVQAILEGRKTQTRRLVKAPDWNIITIPDWANRESYESGVYFWVVGQRAKSGTAIKIKPPCKPGDILWVREAWKQATTGTAGQGLIDLYLYRADEPQDTTGMMVEDRWHPSIHMPRKAARIFLRVKEVRLERLHEIMDAPPGSDNPIVKEGCTYGFEFIAIWDNTINPAERSLYGWNANPWVWVIEFERIDGGPARLFADRNTAQYADGGALAPAT